MWSRLYGEQRKSALNKAIEFTGDASLYGSWMLRVIEAWPISCEHNLTDYGMNRKAWIGHAACCLAISAPEDITRLAWGYLSDRQRSEANHKAEEAIHAWESWYAKENKGIHQDVDGAGLFSWPAGRGGPGAGIAEQGTIIPGNL